MQNNRKSTGRKCLYGYGAAAAADAGPYNFVFMYFLFFLTNVAGIEPAFAGTILLVATLWDIIASPIAAQLSDNFRSGRGRRRPFMIAAAVPLAVILTLMFTAFDFAPAVKNVYFLIATVLFWSAYAVFIIPYYALAAEITSDYEERTKLRAPFIICNNVGNLIGMSAPLAAVALFVGRGFSNPAAWTLVALILGLVSCLAIVVSWACTKGGEIPQERLGKGEHKRDGMFRVYWNIIRLRPCKWLIALTVGFMLAYNMVNSSMAYYVSYNMGASEDMMSAGLLIMILMNMALAPGICALALRAGRGKALALCIAVCVVLAFVLRSIGIDGSVMFTLFLIAFGVGSGAYWQIVQSQFYDLCELYEYEYGERMEGAVNALNIILIKVGSAIAIWFVGIMLQMGGYDASAAVQSAAALNAIDRAFTIIPFLLMIFMAVIAALYPLTKEKYDLLAAVLKKKNAGETYTTKGLEKIVYHARQPIE